MKILAQTMKDGAVRVVETPPPLLASGCVRVRTIMSAISPGTEGNKIVTGRMSLIGKARAKPEQVRQVLDMVGQLGLQATYQKVRDKLDGAQPLGYSLAGRVIGKAEDVEEFAVGDLVACAGGGYANHADEVVVPRNLVAKVPPGVGLDKAALTTLAAIALQGVRLARPTLGENALVVGLGPIGLMACQLLKANGCRVVAADISPGAVALAEAEARVDAGVILGAGSPDERIMEFSRGQGVDLVLICAATASSEPVELAGRVTRQRGRVVVVGAVGMDLPRTGYYEKELEFRVSCSYGPGRYDPSYEEAGIDYPYGFVRWTEGRNMEAVLDLMASGAFDPLPFVTHRFPFEEAPQAYGMIADRSEPYCGILLEYAQTQASRDGAVDLPGHAVKGDLRIGFVGAGSFAQSFLLPPLKAEKGVAFSSIFTRTGLTSADVGGRYGFRRAVASEEDVIADESTDAVVIVTRHDQHGPLVRRALEAGKHVFVEKPLALNDEELDAIEAAASGGGILLTGFNRRFSAAAARVKAHFGADPGPLTMMYRIAAGRIPKDHWIQDPVAGGGRIVGEICHFIDLMQFLCGGDPVSVTAHAVETRNAAVTAADNLVIGLGFSDGSVGTIGYFAEGARNVPKEVLEVHGAGRTAVLENFSAVRLYGGRIKVHRRCAGKGHAEEMGAFVRGLREGRSPISLASQLATTRATFRILDCLVDGRAHTVGATDRNGES